MSALRRRRYMGTCTRRYRRQAATIGDDIARNKKICFLRRSPMGILLYCYLKTMRRTKRRKNRGLLRLLNKQKRMISISWSLYESFQQFITREVKKKENCWMKISELLNTTTQEVERRYKTIRTSFTRYLTKRRGKSGSGLSYIGSIAPQYEHLG